MTHGVTYQEALAPTPTPGFAEVFTCRNLKVELYTLRGVNPQTPHLQDEVYAAVAGTGTFGPGNLLFAAVGAEHQFTAFSENSSVWVVFYGPEGGERPGIRTVLGQGVRK